MRWPTSRALTAAPPAGGATQVLDPGELAYRRELDSRRDGIRLLDSTWEAPRVTGGRYGVVVDEPA